MVVRDTAVETLLPSFSRAPPKFSEPRGSFQKTLNRAADLLALLEERVGAAAASEFEGLLRLSLPAEETLPETSASLTNEVLLLRKQQLLSLATEAFARRVEREETLASYFLQQTFFSAIKARDRGDDLPASMQRHLSLHPTPINMDKEEAEIEYTKQALELALARERAALDDLLSNLQELSSHVAAMEILLKLDAHSDEWRSKLPPDEDRDAGGLMHESVFTKYATSLKRLYPFVLAIVKYSRETLADESAGFRALLLMRDVVAARRKVNRRLTLACDPAAEKLEPETAAALRMDAYAIHAEIDGLQQQAVSLLQASPDRQPNLEAWLPLVL